MSAQIGGHFIARGATFEGEVILLGAKVERQLSASGATFEAEIDMNVSRFAQKRCRFDIYLSCLQAIAATPSATINYLVKEDDLIVAAALVSVLSRRNDPRGWHLQGRLSQVHAVTRSNAMQPKDRQAA